MDLGGGGRRPTRRRTGGEIELRVRGEKEVGESEREEEQRREVDDPTMKTNASEGKEDK